MATKTFLITYVPHIIFLLGGAALEYNMQGTKWGHTDNRYRLMVKKLQPHFGDSSWDSRFICAFPEAGNLEALLFSAG